MRLNCWDTGNGQARNTGALRQLGLALGTAFLLAACGGNETGSAAAERSLAATSNRSGLSEIFSGAGGKFAAASADESLAAEIGRDILQSGGNATDAAAAMYFAMAVTLPSAAGLGAAGVCIVHDAKTRAGESFVFAPQAAPGPINGVSFMIPIGPRAITLMHIRHGKLRWEQVLAPAERLARVGFPVPRALSRDLQVGAASLIGSETRRIYGKGTGTAITEGDTWSETDLAATIGVLRQRGGQDFFSGNFARLLSTQIDSMGGSLPLDALRNAVPKAGPPDSVSYGGFKVYVAPAPMAGASALAGWNNEPAISNDIPTNSNGISGLAAVDADGNAAACSMSMGQLFGARMIVPGTGIMLGAMTADSAAVSPLVIGNPGNGEFRFTGAGGGSTGAAYAAGAVARQSVEKEQSVGGILNARRGQGGYVNAIACPSGIKSYGAACNTGIDPSGPGLALITQPR